MNKVFLMGKVESVEVKQVNDKDLTKLKLMTTEEFEGKKYNSYHSVVFWKGCEAQIGDMVLVEGKLKTSSYEKNGEKRYVTEVIALNIFQLFGESKEKSNYVPF